MRRLRSLSLLGSPVLYLFMYCVLCRDGMLMTCTMDETERDELAETFNSIYLNQYSWDCGLLSAGGVLSVVDSILQDSRAGLAVVRPPGHHAEQVYFCSTGRILFP